MRPSSQLDRSLLALGLLAALTLSGAACTSIPVGGAGEGGSADDGDDDGDGDGDDDGDDDDVNTSSSGDGGAGSAGVGPSGSVVSSGQGPTGSGPTGSGSGSAVSGSSGQGGGGSTLCAPCQDNAACGAGNICLQNGDTGETFCGQDCTGGDCPGGFTCYEVPDGAGSTFYQCAPDAGTCEGSSSGSGSGSGVGGGSSGSGGGNESGALQGITSYHNDARANVSPAAPSPIPELVWDEGIAATAQAYAENCVFQHSGGPYGENLYATSVSATAADVVGSWVSEVSDYNYQSNSCSGVCGHYTQVVWADSVHLGCGVATCTTGSPFGGGSWENWVCNYDPPGNYVGQRPY